jgi:3-oxoadipate enol-lactonase
MSEGKVACSDGTKLSFRVLGNGAKRIALVHSLAMDQSFWLPVAERLAGDSSVLIYDCRGHGASDKPSGPYTAERFARDLSELMTHIGWDSAVVAGASMGGCVSLAFAAQFPQRTKGLSPIDTTAWYGADAPAAWEGRATRAATEGLKALVDFQVTRWFSEAFRASHPEVVQKCLDVFLANDVPAYAETCRMLGSFDLRTALRGITCPTTVIVGEEDYASPVAMAQALKDGIANSRLVVIEKARHLTPLEVPDIIASELRKLLAVA